eukprot:PhM_4_TR11874/c0_g1_i1/m.69527
MNKCPRCKGPNIIEHFDDGYIFCEDCGVCVGEITDDNSGFDVARADVADVLDADIAKDLAEADVARVRSDRQVIQNIAEKVALPAAVSQEAARLLAKFTEFKRRRSERIANRDDLVAACIHFAASQAKLSVTLREIASAMRTDFRPATIAKLEERLRTLLPGGQQATAAQPTAALDKYAEIVERSMGRLLIPGVHLKTVASTMARTYEEKVGGAKPGALVGALLLHILTSVEAAELSGMARRSVVPSGSPAEKVIVQRLAQTFGVSIDDIDGVMKKLSADVSSQLLTAAREAVEHPTTA